MDLLLDQEEKITCPYNPAHYIMRRRMNTHLAKCKKNYPDSKLVECDFNVNHKIPEPELQYHHEICPDRRKVEHTVYQEEGVVLNKFPVHNVAVSLEESWDTMNLPSYDPKKYCESSEVLRHLDVASAATRKNFRIGERSRVNCVASDKKETSKVQPLARDPVTPRRNLPETPRTTVEESTPEEIAQLMQRLQLGKGKAFIPKQN